MDFCEVCNLSKSLNCFTFISCHALCIFHIFPKDLYCPSTAEGLDLNIDYHRLARLLYVGQYFHQGNFLDDQHRLIYHVAKIIKSDVSTCKGIITKLPNVSDISLTACKSVIPESLNQLLRLKMSKPEKDEDLAKPTCSNKADKRRILMLAQDIVFCASHSQSKMQETCWPGHDTPSSYRVKTTDNHVK